MNTFETLIEARNLLDQVINRNVGSIGHVDLPAEALASKQKLLNGLNTERAVFDIVNAINVLAMANADVIHIFTRYSAHVNRLSVDVEPLITDYSSCPREKLFIADVRINEEDALDQLLAIESKLTELIIEAREQAEANVEVEA